MSLYVKMIPSLGIFLLFVLGCGGSGETKGAVSGKVTYKRGPVTEGSISFRMQSKGIIQDAKLDANGAFTMAEPFPAGTYQVCYVPPTPEPVDPTKGKVPVIKSVLPKKHLDIATSGVSVEVTAGSNTIPIDFKD